jgi:hypothetical protein
VSKNKADRKGATFIMLTSGTSDEIEARYFSYVFKKAVTGNPFAVSAAELTNLNYYTQTSFFRRYPDKNAFFRKAMRKAIRVVDQEKMFDPLDAFKEGKDKTIYKGPFYPDLAYFVKFGICGEVPDLVYTSFFSPYIINIQHEFSTFAPELKEKEINDLASFYFKSRLNILDQKIEGNIQNSQMMPIICQVFGKYQHTILIEASRKNREGVKRNATREYTEETDSALSRHLDGRCVPFQN